MKVYLLLCAVALAVATTANGWPLIHPNADDHLASPIVNGQGKRSPVLGGGAYSPSSDGQVGKTEALGRVVIPNGETEVYKDGVRGPSLALGSLGKKPESNAQSRCHWDPIC
ncbi:uncharacterized protein LOC144885261 [Branchiostoma floridae x Branchiostoma japonicum]